MAVTPVICSPLIGASLTTVWKPPTGVTAGAAGDATAPFSLGTLGWSVVGKQAQFARAAGSIADAATTGITAGVTAAAAAGNTWTNTTGSALVLGDYAWFTANAATAPFA